MQTPVITHRLTQAELGEIERAIDCSPDKKACAGDAALATIRVLLRSAGLSLENFSEDNRVVVTNLSIPEDQWRHICARVMACGGNPLSWMNWGPSAYTVTN